ncbi:MAG TPA: type II toxin-antitoxin system HicB family antitoxin [Spirochaetota bacterium]|nr:type II toxin-antitoxin system HicB family antitoxin [Spirochaetota bacterium]
MKYHFKTHKEDSGYCAECVELYGCRTEADSIEELKTNMHEALNLYLEEPEGSGVEFVPPQEGLTGRYIVEVAVEPNIAFAVYLRYLRKQRRLTQKQVAEKLKLKNLYSYQRLESGKANPTLETIVKIHSLFPEMDLASIIPENNDALITRRKAGLSGI